MDKDALLLKAQEMGLTVDKRWGEARLRAAIEDALAAQVPELVPEVAPVSVVAEPEAVPANVPPLGEYIASVEGAHIGRDVVAVAVSHPDVSQDHVHAGTYGGIRVTRGPLSVTYSDGCRG